MRALFLDPESFAALFASLVIFIGCAAIGAVISNEGHRFAAADPLVGLGAATGTVTLLGVTTRLPLSVWLTLVGLAALTCCAWLAWTRQRCGGSGQWLALLLLLPLLLLTAHQGPTHWDEFRQWLQNAAYIYRHDSFPHPTLPPSASGWPGYPYAIPLFIDAVSLLTGRFLPTAGALLNLLLLATGVAVLIATIAEVCEDGNRRPELGLSRNAIVGLVGICVPAVTLLSPAFDQSFTLTALPDSATSVATATGALLVWQVMERLAENRHDQARSLALRFGCVGVFLIDLKQANGVLLVLLVSAFLLITVRDSRLRPGWALRLLPAMLGPGLIVGFAWHFYVSFNVPGGEFSVLPPAEWHVELLAQILGGMGWQMLEHPWHFGLMLTLSGAGVLSLWRMRTSIDRLLGITAVMWIGYTCFLLGTYIAVFSVEEAVTAVQFWRYSTHFGLVGLTTLAALLARYWLKQNIGRSIPAAAMLGLALVPVEPIFLQPRLMPTISPDLPFCHEVGRFLADTLPDGARLAVLDPTSSGFFFFVVNYEIARPGRKDHDLRAVWQVDLWHAYPEQELPRVAGSFNDMSLSHILIIDPTPEYAQALGVRAERKVFLLERGDGAWQIARSWNRGSGDHPDFYISSQS
jgi:hypothetical protein